MAQGIGVRARRHRRDVGQGTDRSSARRARAGARSILHPMVRGPNRGVVPDRPSRRPVAGGFVDGFADPVAVRLPAGRVQPPATSSAGARRGL